MDPSSSNSPGASGAGAAAAAAVLADATPVAPTTTSPIATPTPHLAHPPGHVHGKTSLLALGALGVVYGDIGTSPLYALRDCFHTLHTTEAGTNVDAMVHTFGVVSMVTWALIFIVVLKYLSFALRADNQGEGGILALLALLTSSHTATGGSAGAGETKPPEKRTYVIILALMAGSLLIADGLITPAISVLSAVEGLEVAAPVFHHWILPITLIILLAIFLIQKYGTARIGVLFGPLTFLWFATLGVLGAIQVAQHPGVLAAISPHHAIRLIIIDPLHSFVLLGSVILVLTGAEALYADMGHFGRRAIRIAWYSVVMPGLLLNYYGQAAVVMTDPSAAANPFWAVVPPPLYMPVVIIATIATIIASQAMISGAYSLANQAVQLGYSPRLRVVHTSHTIVGQIYVPEINLILAVSCIALVLTFRTSSALTAMYGLAVTGTMTITSCLLYLVAVERWNWPKWRARAVIGSFLIVDLLFLSSSVLKIPHGGWVALVAAAIVFLIMIVWYEGRGILARPVYSISLPMAVLMRDVEAGRIVRVPGTAVFLAARPGVVPAVMLHHLKHNQILHERVVLLSVRTAPVPKVPEESRVSVKPLTHGFYEVTAMYGFIETPDVPTALRACNVHGLDVDPDMASYYVGRVTLRIMPGGGVFGWFKRLFAFLYLNERPVTAFFNLPANRVVELGRQLEL